MTVTGPSRAGAQTAEGVGDRGPTRSVSALGFTREECQGRVARTRATMTNTALDAVCLTAPEDIYYLTGLDHQGYFAFTMLVLPRTGDPLLVARRMEQHTLSAQVPWCRHVPFGDGDQPADAVLAALRELPEVTRVGVDKAGLWFPVQIWEDISRGLPGVEFVDTSAVLAEQRRYRSPAELDHLRRAGTLSSAAMRAGLDTIRVGVNARDIAAAVYADLISRGSEPPGFAPLIRFRENLLEEHVTWPDRVVVPGDAVFMELSASVGRYHAPLTRMAYVGEPPAGTGQAARVAADGMDAVTSALVPGARSCDVYAAWQAVVDAGLGHDRYRRHHCGYQVGIGFPPSWVGGPHVVGLRPDSTWQVREGMTFHVLSWLLGQEPADYVLSDTVLVTAGGGQLFTDVSRDPIVIPTQMQ